jgi:serine/threonine protein kinase
VPPFNDDSVELVFQHILDRNIPWPPAHSTTNGDSDEIDGFPPVARAFIEALLALDPSTRPSSRGIRGHPLFDGVQWDALHTQDAPFVPHPENELDTGYFQDRAGAPTSELGIVFEDHEIDGVDAEVASVAIR